MAETLVDIGYRGVSVAKRARLVEVRPSTAFVELAAPMPVGSPLTLVDDAGQEIGARVMRVREQVSGVAAVAGMTVAPDLADDAVRAWWQARVELPADADPTERIPVIAIAAAASAAVAAPLRATTTAPMAAVAAPRDTDVAGAAVAAALVAATRASPATRPPPVSMVEDDHSRRTRVMDAVTADVLVEMTAGESGSKLIDDGKRTEMMASVDLAALGLDPASSGKLPGMPEPASTRAQTDVDPAEPDDPPDPPDGADKPAERPSQAARRRKKRR